MRRIAILMDGGNARVLSRLAGYPYTPDYIEKICLACVGPDEDLLRVLYYDCAPYNGKARLPVSGNERVFSGSDSWLRQLAQKERFAIRLGVLKFRGFKPARVPIAPHAPLTDEDFKPDFEQKGVDMRIGLDIANFCVSRAIDRIVLATSDTDCIPAMKHARKSGLQIALVKFPNSTLAPELLQHSDYVRGIAWPAP